MTASVVPPAASWIERCHAAAARHASAWVVAAGLSLGAFIAMVVVPALPSTGDDLARARALGIVSRTILEGYAKSADTRGFVVGMLVVVGVAIAVWLTWALRAPTTASARGGSASDRRDRRRRDEPDPRPPAEVATPRRGVWVEALVMLLAIALVFCRLDMARNAWSNAWTLLSEEGEMMAWVDTLLRGGALFRDVYCLYGPLAKYPVAQLFTHFGASLWLWRVWIFVLAVPALLLVHWLLRRLLRTRAAAVAGTFAIGLLCASTVPAMSWSISRVALGLGVIAAFDTYRSTQRRALLVLTGVLLGTSLAFSQEIGVCAGVAVAWMIAARAWADRIPAARWAAELVWLTAGFGIVIVPLVIHFAALGTLDDAVQNLFVFPRVRLLGFAALRFPAFAPMLGQLLSGAGQGRLAAWLAAARFYFCPAAFAITVTVLVVRLASGHDPRRLIAPAAVCGFGMLVFQSAVSRPEPHHRCAGSRSRSSPCGWPHWRRTATCSAAISPTASDRSGSR